MKSKHFYFLILLVTLSACAVFGTTLARGIFVSETGDDVPLAGTQEVIQKIPVYATSSVPVRITIPVLGVDADIQHVGRTKKNTMAVPTNYKDVGWYRHGPLPGSRGSAVIAGHLDNGFGLPAVFKRLQELNVGDDVFIFDKEGKQLHFKVIKEQHFESTASSTQEVFGDVGYARLNLITCEGEWDPDIKQYSNRLVVFTELVE